jgi:hypothetical protein
LEATNDVGATFVIVLFNLDVYCHMWARAYHLASIYASRL